MSLNEVQSFNEVQSYKEALPSLYSISQILAIFTGHTGPLCQFTDSAP